MYIGIGYILPTVWGKYISWMYVLVLDILITSYREILKKNCGIRHEGWGGKEVRVEEKDTNGF